MCVHERACDFVCVFLYVINVVPACVQRCAHCKTLEPIYEELASELKDGYTVAKCDASKHVEFAVRTGGILGSCLRAFCSAVVEFWGASVATSCQRNAGAPGRGHLPVNKVAAIREDVQLRGVPLNRGAHRLCAGHACAVIDWALGVILTNSSALSTYVPEAAARAGRVRGRGVR